MSIFAGVAFKVIFEGVKLLKGFFKVIWEAACIPLKIPIGLIVIAVIVGYVYNKNSISKAIAELVAGAELKAQNEIIKNKNKIIDNQQTLLEEKARILEATQKAMQEYQNEVLETEKNLAKARSELNALQTDPTKNDVPAPTDYFDSLLNK